MQIGVDIDGVLAAQIEHFIHLVSHEFGMGLGLEDFSEYNPYFDHIDKSFDNTYKMVMEGTDEYHVGIPLIPSANTVLNEISNKHQVCIITHRPSKVEYETKKWLYHNDIQYDELIHDAPEDKTKARDVDVMIDDRPAVLCKSSADLNILFRRPHNSSFNSDKSILVVGESSNLNHWQETRNIFEEREWI